MTQVDILIAQLAEEASELSVACMKALRFGLHNYNPNHPEEKNHDKITSELADIFSLYDRLKAMGVLFPFTSEQVSIKQEKVDYYLHVSKTEGRC